MEPKSKIEAQIIRAFASVEYPGDWCLRGSNEGDEPYLLEQEFKGKKDWRVLAADFLDQAPDGYGSALSFFSDEAFHFYLPAYMIADLRGEFKRVNPVFHLTHGLDDKSRDERIDPRRFGERTWWDAARFKFSMFKSEEASAIVDYLKARDANDDFERPGIEETLRNYWNDRAAA